MSHFFSRTMKIILLVNLICLSGLANACGPIFNAIFRPPPPPPTNVACQQVSNGPPCLGSTITNCVCSNGVTVTSAICPNNNNNLFFNNGQQCCFNSNQYSGYVSCTCAAGTWVPQYSYYQVQVSSNGQCQGFNGFNGFNGFGKRSTDKVALLEEEVKRMAIKQKEM